MQKEDIFDSPSRLYRDCYFFSREEVHSLVISVVLKCLIYTPSPLDVSQGIAYSLNSWESSQSNIALIVSDKFVHLFRVCTFGIEI